MLILTRKPGEQLTVVTPSGEVITIEITNMRRHQVRIGIEAARDIKIYRTETLQPGDINVLCTTTQEKEAV